MRAIKIPESATSEAEASAAGKAGTTGSPSPLSLTLMKPAKASTARSCAG